MAYRPRTKSLTLSLWDRDFGLPKEPVEKLVIQAERLLLVLQAVAAHEGDAHV